MLTCDAIEPDGAAGGPPRAGGSPISTFTVMVNEASPFAAMFPDGVPVTSPFPRLKNFNGLKEPCYFLDLLALKDDEKLGLWRVLSKLSGIAVEIVAREIARDGLPIRVAMVKCAPGIPTSIFS